MINPIPDELRTGYRAAVRDLRTLEAQLAVVRAELETLHRAPALPPKSKRSAAHPITGGTRVPIWYHNQPDQALAAYPAERGAGFLKVMRTVPGMIGAAASKRGSKKGKPNV